ncbi:hypothetical protein B0T17DRAFT_618948 [Bombardia bombarda]|uniref:Dihydroneopterin aldolase/epimerase domain-containing protein n=1 Tax=Bombardia bombarda TaxID=252184 RepID=A0AA39WMW6_9PEZI|nr:hypothetical protein B0T17DRAFT_618948 [Bombardia bombarda]
MEPTPPPKHGRARIGTSWEVKAAAGEPFAVVRVRNLQSVVQAAKDAWGRTGKSQPLLVSAELSFSTPFDTAAADDRLGADTVHYGNLSKTILTSLGAATPSPSSSSHLTLRDVLETIWSDLTGLSVDGSSTGAKKKPFLSLARVRFLSVTVTLPKASLLGEAVSLTASSVFGLGDGEDGGAAAPRAQIYSIALDLINLRVPTLIGVNPNERLSKQFVVTSVTIDQFGQSVDFYTDIESVVAKALDESSFETLEALGAHLADSIFSNYGHHGILLAGQKPSDAPQWQLHIRMEKPTAVPLADCPVVEIRAGSAFPRAGRTATAAAVDA